MNSHPEFPAAFAGVMFIIIGVAVLFGIALNVLICWLLMNDLKRVPPAHRKMEPGLVWLLLIPCFHLVWNFFVFLRLPESYRSYFTSTGRGDGTDYGRSLGLAFAICAACSIVPFVNYLAGPAALVLLIIVLVKFNGYKNQIPVGAEAGAVPPPPPPAA
jgi:hypothetical protein